MIAPLPQKTKSL